jgi:hypothetical protein
MSIGSITGPVVAVKPKSTSDSSDVESTGGAIIASGFTTVLVNTELLFSYPWRDILLQLSSVGARD